MSASSYTVHRYTEPPTYRVALAEQPELREQVRAAVDSPASTSLATLLVLEGDNSKPNQRVN